MKPVCCDTSFLFALYGSDIHTGRARAFIRGLGQAVTLSVFNEFELENALRFAGWRKLFSVSQVAQLLAAFEEDRKTGRLLVMACDLAVVVNEARGLSVRHTLNHGHRSFDIFHVAAALYGKADTFLSFDANQRKLARSEGLTVLP